MTPWTATVASKSWRFMERSLVPYVSSSATGTDSLLLHGPVETLEHPSRVILGWPRGGIISPTIFNVVVDEVLWYRVTMAKMTKESVEPDTAVMEGFGRNV